MPNILTLASERFRWWLSDRICPIETNRVVRDVDEVREFVWLNRTNWDLSDEETQKATDYFGKMQDHAHALDLWRRGDIDLVWDGTDDEVAFVDQR